MKYKYMRCPVTIFTRKIKLPAENPSLNSEEDKDRDIPTRASTRMTRYTIDLPKAAIAGLVGERAEALDDVQDTTPRVVPLSHTWSPSGDVYVGCQGGQILKVLTLLNQATLCNLSINNIVYFFSIKYMIYAYFLELKIQIYFSKHA